VKLEQFYEDDRCDVPLKVTLKDGTVEYAWECGIQLAEIRVLDGYEHSTGERRDWRRAETEISEIEILSTEEYRQATGWTGFL
jgi:hypothetical protein